MIHYKIHIDIEVIKMEEIVWGVMYAMGLLLAGTGFVIVYIMKTAYIEISDENLSSSFLPSSDSNITS